MIKTILVTGGTSGIGKGIVIEYLKKDYQVIAVGSSSHKGELLIKEAAEFQASERLDYVQADLSLIEENYRLINYIEKNYFSLDKVVFCATSHKAQGANKETPEGFEFNFALNYLSRFILSFGLTDVLKSSKEPVILNVCAPGMKGEVNFQDIQIKENRSIKTMYHNSRLNDLLGVSYHLENGDNGIKYILYNPWAVQTQGTFDAIDNPLKKNVMKAIYKIVGKSVEEGIKPIVKLLEHPPQENFSAFKLDKRISLNLETFNSLKAERLYEMTSNMLKENTNK